MSENKLFFSVVIPLYNKKSHIQRSVFSVLNQSYGNFELIVVDDGSTDGSLDEIKDINDKRLKIFEKENGGVSSARNFGIKNASADYVAFLDADDEWNLAFLENICEMYRLFPDKGMYATGYRLVDENTEIIKVIKNKEQVFKIKDYFQEFLNLRAPVNNSSTTVIKRDLLFTVGLFPEDLKNFEDWNVSYKVALFDDVIYSQRVLSSVYLDTINRSSQGVNTLILLNFYNTLTIDIENFILQNKLQRGSIDAVFQRKAQGFMNDAIKQKQWNFLDTFKKSELYKYTNSYQKIVYASSLNRLVFMVYKIMFLMGMKK